MGQVPERRLEPPIEWEREPQCPVCGNVCEEVFRNKWDEIVGCDECLTRFNATETDECYE